ncbi:hypothetical protein MNEG_14277 [Monoraphidium neglectum]|uniref:Uncharacterized protein n=1 Tax=Monoraphidium neglectum TaxID=145388 RepID=A0A0D2LVW1_9CHLO|nr:hypothetical protein MNEG_14277 [Monoraphidium neglectum]KIY93686.1 hypothetical protein MNEG_14277 [Monoraphidium neglectum]|eukprot:XP_013892706.1 hypothetical protein MNEG_14277 [Monoraphidium neglectum]
MNAACRVAPATAAAAAAGVFGYAPDGAAPGRTAAVAAGGGGSAPKAAAVRDSSQFGGKVSLQRFARGQVEASDDSSSQMDVRVPKVVHYADSQPDQARHARDAERAGDAGSSLGSRDAWVAAAQITSPPLMRVLQDAVTMSREDLERLEKRGRRQGWLARIAKLLAGLAAAAALGAATVIVVRTAWDDCSGGRCNTDDAQLEPLAPRLPSLRPLGHKDGGAKARRGGRRGEGGGGAGGGGLVLQMPQMPFVPVFPAPNPLDSRG